MCDSFAHCHGYLWGVCHMPLHRCTKNGSLWVGDFNGESIFWSVRVGAYCICPRTYRVDDSIAHCHGHLWGVCNTPLHWYTKNGAFRVGGFNGESIFWSVRVWEYCIRPSTYRAGDSIDRRELNFWSVSVGAYCIRPQTYRADDSIDRGESNFWSVRVGVYCIRPQTYRVLNSIDRWESNFWRV